LNIPFLSKSKKIEFINEIDGVAQLMPLIPAQLHRNAWVDRAVRDFAKLREMPKWNHEKTIHTARCPGIFSLQRHGWILRTWQDIEITTYGDGNNFIWKSATGIGGDAVGNHPPDQLANFFDEWPQNTLRTIVKIHTGWRCIIPKGYYLMEMPLPLGDEQRFTAIPGYFSRESGPAHMNVQLMWHVMSGSTLIKAGTPIAQYVLVPKDQPEIECRDVEKRDGLRLPYLYDASKFVKNYGEVKKLFGK
jgi:hypothetical protein